MPHIIAEYSDNLSFDVDALLHGLHDALAEEPSVDKARIKTRAISLAHYVVGEDADANEMVHVTLKVLPRADDVREKMTLSLQKAAQKIISGAYPNCKITVECQHLDAHSYCA